VKEKKIISYKVVSQWFNKENQQFEMVNFINLVNQNIYVGWEPYGSFFVKGDYFYQALVLREK
tara:strand:- start:237 stop:425 length:189 start_codon:yes stop_codon:yes gene_type:complete